MSFESAELRAAWAGVSAAFAALGRVFFCLGSDFRILHASAKLDEIAGEGAAAAMVGRDAADVLGGELFGAHGSLRHALLAGERREGWRATLRARENDPRLVSISVAPMGSVRGDVCDPRVAFIVALRPADEDPNVATASAPTAFAGIVARSPAMTRIFGLIENLSHSDATILLTGESGTGKELVARAIHRHSPRSEGPFVAVNCAALPGDLLESEMFGHVRGAFTGAVRDRPGRFELATGGTLFLDEVGDLPLPLQVKLLRVLQERTFERVGESRTRTTDARIVAATNADLQRGVASGQFREDLYYRLRVVPIEIPPLRDRREDIEPLTRSLLARVGGRHGRVLRLAPETVRALLRYPWPGNVRELENALEYAVAVSKGETLLPEDLPLELEPGPQPPPTSSPHPDTSLPAEERDRLLAALESHRWNRAAAARALGISRTTLWRRMREAGLDR